MGGDFNVSSNMVVEGEMAKVMTEFDLAKTTTCVYNKMSEI